MQNQKNLISFIFMSLFFISTNVHERNLRIIHTLCNTILQQFSCCSRFRLLSRISAISINNNITTLVKIARLWFIGMRILCLLAFFVCFMYPTACAVNEKETFLKSDAHRTNKFSSSPAIER